MDYPGRLRRLSAQLVSPQEVSRQVDALLVTHLPNVRYLTGFTGSAAVLLASAKPMFFTDGRYREQAAQQVRRAKVVIPRGNALSAAVKACQAQRITRLGVEADRMSVSQFQALRRELGKGVKIVPLVGVVEALRAVKDPAEIKLIRQAVELSSGLFPALLKALKPGQTELSAAARLEYLARQAGAEAMSFETIIASGKRSALPHGVASPARLPARGFVVLDYGVVTQGYSSDMTRTIHLGRATARERAVYAAVLEAQLAGINALRPGATCGQVDEAARRVLRRAGLAKFFTHSTGHGVGLEIHEPPRLGARGEAVLEAGMVVTVEPGAYLPGRYGVRIEDMVLVTATGAEVLTPVGKALTELL
jgi:Xaa-Pro aminopeptidase